MGKSKKSESKTDDNRRKNTSLRLSARTLKALKIRAIEEETSVQQIVERLIETYLNKKDK